MRRIPHLLLIGGLLLSVLSSSPVFAEKTGTSITIEQQNLAGSIGKWTLLTPHDQFIETENKRVLYNVPQGIFTLFVTPPKGASTSIRVRRNEEVLATVDVPQVTFSAQTGDQIHVSVSYIFTRVGVVGVQSDPAGLQFELRGPDNSRILGVTPESYLRLPEGQYTVHYQTLEGCTSPPLQSLLLEKDGRITFSVTLTCKNAEQQRKMMSEQERGDGTFVTVPVEGRTVTFTDVPQSTWFAPFVFRSAKHGVISGYKDEDGVPTGTFGPNNLVTRGELAKIAHKIAGAMPMNGIPPKNTSARGEWFASYVTSAEEQGWTIFLDHRMDTHAPALRGEVIVTLLQILDIPLHWPKGDIFSDVHPFTPFAGAIETAAQEGMVDSTQPFFRSSEPINRAEMAKLITITMDKMQ
ncbi:hypothetical protein COU77_04180 [Candidatus Peregrinibacteria bacterium CG10_big_fil_rev_8_21_14_0_10_49_16]|nr:MAG: hypothetical protein COW95_03280 [Candidatus Peregrinibacteria bacterium CG22_combo_CG10-13_8_21_14_all_49_11]PIR51731.1 MAG: hypothetical protein COU77_04180 [Candidatus Peregrinibacteria bacterium CG10_big_fil_rev_8_21_14_0_10_49_16]